MKEIIKQKKGQGKEGKDPAKERKTNLRKDQGKGGKDNRNVQEKKGKEKKVKRKGGSKE